MGDIDMLRHQLSTEEKTCKRLENKIDMQSEEIVACKEQINMYETLVRAGKEHQFSSTPFQIDNGIGIIQDAADLKIPYSKLV